MDFILHVAYLGTRKFVRQKKKYYQFLNSFFQIAQ